MEGFDELLDGLMTAVWMVGTSAFIIRVFTSCHKAVFLKLFFLCTTLTIYILYMYH